LKWYAAFFAAAFALAPALPAAAAPERIYVLLTNTSADRATIELIGSDRIIEEFELASNGRDQRIVTLSSPIRVRYFSPCAAHAVTENVSVQNSRTTIMIYVHKNCTLQVSTYQK
jgi:hypothetical protein